MQLRRIQRTLLPWLLGAAAALAPLQTRAWSGHTLCTWQALSVMPGLQEATVSAEPLAQFLAAQATALEPLLREHEAWARANLPDYPARPDALTFRANNSGPLVPAFLAALRLNSESRLKLFVQLRPGQARADQARMPWVDITALKSGSAARENTYVLLDDGAEVAALDVVASASAEPDYGLDIGLFTDSGTAQGRSFGYGAQPFGNGAVDYSSQAPFHMAFFHEAGIITTAAPFLKRTQPEARVALFSALARHAFASGHRYWGWRFTGWAMHYLQDLTQPYHARALPGVSTPRMLAINALDLVGLPTAKNHAVTLVTNRHIVIENYQFKRMSAAYDAGHWNDALLQALRHSEQDEERGPYQLQDLRKLISAQAAASADALDAQLARSFPARYTSDPNQALGNEADQLNLFAIAQAHSATEHAALEAQLVTLMTRLGQHSRALVRALLLP